MQRATTLARRPDDVTLVEEPEFTALFRRTSPQVLAYVRRRLDDPSADWDTVNEVFIVAWRKRAELPATPAEHLPWLLAVAGNAVRNSNRSSRRRRGLELQAARQRRPGPSSVVPEGDSLVAVTAAMGRLSGRDQELIRLVAWEELNMTEIGQVLGLRPGAVRVRLHRARARLEKALSEDPGTPASAPALTGVARPPHRKA